MTAGGFVRVQKLDPVRIVRRLREEHQVMVDLVGPCPGGQVGAAYVTFGGCDAVLTWTPNIALGDQRLRESILDRIRARALPVPEIFGSFQIGDDVVVLQERLPGSTIDRLTDELARQMIQFNKEMRDVFEEPSEDSGFALYLTEPGPGYCLHEPLRRHSAETRRLLGWIEEVGRGQPPLLSGDDVVHGDYHPGNVLAHDRTVSGIIDWDGACRGDGRLDLVTLRFGLLTKESSHAAVERVDATLATIPVEVLRVCWAHMSLRMVDWAIRHFTDAEVKTWTKLATARME